MISKESQKRTWSQSLAEFGFDLKFLLTIIGFLIAFYISVYTHHTNSDIHHSSDQLKSLYVQKEVWEACEKGLDQRLTGIEKSLDKIETRLEDNHP